MISSDAIAEFEQQTGIKVYAQYVESNEELLAKFKVSGGIGYDLLTLTDYMVEIFRHEGLLHTIDKSKITHFNELDTRFCNKFFDPNNTYCIPIMWTIYGIIYDKNTFGGELSYVSFDMLFKNPKEHILNKTTKRKYKVCMTDDARESLFFSSIYLYNSPHKLTAKQFEKIQETLVKQKRWVECYTNVSTQYFLVGNIVAAAIIASNHAKKILISSDRFDFKIPKEGSVFFIENLAIPAKSKKLDLVYKFIDFLLTTHIQKEHFDTTGDNPVNKSTYAQIDQKFLNNPNFFPPQEIFEKLHLIHNEFCLKTIEDLWLGVKFA
jgi:spermidine/putrescine transport system substrate-binding protein